MTVSPVLYAVEFDQVPVLLNPVVNNFQSEELLYGITLLFVALRYEMKILCCNNIVSTQKGHSTSSLSTHLIYEFWKDTRRPYTYSVVRETKIDCNIQHIDYFFAFGASFPLPQNKFHNL